MEKLGIFSISLFLLFIICTAMGAGPASASSLIMTPSEEVSLKAGESVEVSLGVDELPEGLSGYILTVAIEDPAVAEITAVSFPEWVSIKSNSALPASSVQITAAELNRRVEAGASNVPLATLTLKGLEGGSARIAVTVGRMEDDVENTFFLEGAKNPTPKDENPDPEDKPNENKTEEDNKTEEADKVKTQSSGSFVSSSQSETPETEKIGVSDENENKAGKNPGQENEAENDPISLGTSKTAQSEPGNASTESKNRLPGFGSAGTVSILILFGLFGSSKN